ncbi:Uncharacterised protein [Mycobacteroides abscessus subsp. abscessus]|nr:Uncharacterised protein [Mycobacteroides abscessus subsp. abscessus]
MGSFLQRHNQKDLIFLADLIEEGKVREGHARGKVVISMSHSSSA